MSEDFTPGPEPFMRLAREPVVENGAATFAAFAPMNDQPALADRKATFVLAVSGMLLSTLLFFTPKLNELLVPEWGSRMVLVAILMLICILVAAVRTAYGAYYLMAPRAPENPLFFFNVAAFSKGDYEKEIRSYSHPEAIELLLDYNYTMACLGAKKFRLVGRSMMCLRFAIPLWMLLLLVLGLRG